MKVLEYNLVPVIIDTKTCRQVGEYPIKVVIGLTEQEEDFICEIIDNDMDFDFLYDEVKKLNQVIYLYIKEDYSNKNPNDSHNVIHLTYKVKSAEDISGHMYETNDESIVTTWLDMANKRKMANIGQKTTTKQSTVTLFDGNTITVEESMQIQEGVFYHGTDARIVRMSKAQRDSFTKDINIVLTYLWPFFEPYRFCTEHLKDTLSCNSDSSLWVNASNAIIRYSAMLIGNVNYQYGALYLCNFISRAADYAFRSFAFGESGCNAFYMIKAAEQLKFEGWNPKEEVVEAINRIIKFGSEKPEPVIFKFTDVDYLNLLDESGRVITEENKKMYLSCGTSFRYKQELVLDLHNTIKLTKGTLEQ